MDSLPFIIPIASAVFLANAFWSCALSCRVRHLQRRIEVIEDEREFARTQQHTQPTITTAIPVIPPVYYPQQQTTHAYPPPLFRPMPSAPTGV